MDTGPLQQSPYFGGPRGISGNNLDPEQNVLDSDDSFDLDAHIEKRIDEEIDEDRSPKNPDSCLEIPFVSPSGSASDKRLQLKSVNKVPQPYDQLFRPMFPYFNVVQSSLLEDALNTDKNLVVSAPTGSGKTVIFELGIIRELLVRKTESVCVYLAPIKALCSERFNDWTNRFKKLEEHKDAVKVNCLELTGDTYSDEHEMSALEGRLDKHNLILTTPEKWDATTRRFGKVGNDFTRRIRLILLDEVHLLNDESRGHTLEAIVTRIKMTLGKSLSSNVRFIAVSATVPNGKDVAQWLTNQKSKVSDSVCYEFGDERRPVPLRRVVLGFPYDGKSDFKFEMNLTYRLSNVIRTYSENKPTLIFVNSRRSAQMTASTLYKELRHSLISNMSLGIRRKLEEASYIISNDSSDHNKLKESIVSGIGFHHAGLTSADRGLVEDLFRSGCLPILVSTTTLALGVNLPAHLVIVKATSHMVAGEFREYEESQILQMLGRAGRPQYDTSATAVIMTTSQQKQLYEALVSGSKPLESGLADHLEEHLNAEIVMGNITDVSIAMEWIKSTFLYVRLLQNPSKYTKVIGKETTRDKIERNLEQFCMRAINGLWSAALISMDDTMSLGPADAGRLMAHYYMAFQTLKNFRQLVTNNVSGHEIKDLLQILCGSKELQDSLQLRRSEKGTLNLLNGSDGKKQKTQTQRPVIRFPVGAKVATISQKANVLIQAQLGCLHIGGEPNLVREGQRLLQLGVRVSRCLCEYILTSNAPYTTLKSAIELSKCLKCGLWEDSPFVSKQFDGVGITYSTSLVNAGLISFDSIKIRNPREIEMIINRPAPFGNRLRDNAKFMPEYSIEIEVKGEHDIIRCAKTLTIVIRISLKNILDLRQFSTAGRHHSCHLLAGNPVTGKTYFKGKVKDSSLLAGSFERQFAATFYPEQVKNCLEVAMISEKFVGIDVAKRFVVGAESATNRKPNLPPQTPIRVKATPSFKKPAQSPKTQKSSQKLIPSTPRSSQKLIPSTPRSSLMVVPSTPRSSQKLVPSTPLRQTFLDNKLGLRKPTCQHNCRDRSKCGHPCCLNSAPVSPLLCSQQKRFEPQNLNSSQSNIYQADKNASGPTEDKNPKLEENQQRSVICSSGPQAQIVDQTPQLKIVSQCKFDFDVSEIISAQDWEHSLKSQGKEIPLEANTSKNEETLSMKPLAATQQRTERDFKASQDTTSNETSSSKPQQQQVFPMFRNLNAAEGIFGTNFVKETKNRTEQIVIYPPPPKPQIDKPKEQISNETTGWERHENKIATKQGSTLDVFSSQDSSADSKIIKDKTKLQKMSDSANAKIGPGGDTRLLANCEPEKTDSISSQDSEDIFDNSMSGKEGSNLTTPDSSLGWINLGNPGLKPTIGNMTRSQILNNPMTSPDKVSNPVRNDEIRTKDRKYPMNDENKIPDKFWENQDSIHAFKKLNETKKPFQSQSLHFQNQMLSVDQHEGRNDHPPKNQDHYTDSTYHQKQSHRTSDYGQLGKDYARTPSAKEVKLNQNINHRSVKEFISGNRFWISGGRSTHPESQNDFTKPRIHQCSQDSHYHNGEQYSSNSQRQRGQSSCYHNQSQAKAPTDNCIEYEKQFQNSQTLNPVPSNLGNSAAQTMLFNFCNRSTQPFSGISYTPSPKVTTPDFETHAEQPFRNTQVQHSNMVPSSPRIKLTQPSLLNIYRQSPKMTPSGFGTRAVQPSHSSQAKAVPSSPRIHTSQQPSLHNTYYQTPKMTPSDFGNQYSNSQGQPANMVPSSPRIQSTHPSMCNIYLQSQKKTPSGFGTQAEPAYHNSQVQPSNIVPSSPHIQSTHPSMCNIYFQSPKKTPSDFGTQYHNSQVQPSNMVPSSPHIQSTHPSMQNIYFQSPKMTPSDFGTQAEPLYHSSQIKPSNMVPASPRIQSTQPSMSNNYLQSPKKTPSVFGTQAMQPYHSPQVHLNMVPSSSRNHSTQPSMRNNYLQSQQMVPSDFTTRSSQPSPQNIQYVKRPPKPRQDCNQSLQLVQHDSQIQTAIPNLRELQTQSTKMVPSESRILSEQPSLCYSRTQPSQHFHSQPLETIPHNTSSQFQDTEFDLQKHKMKQQTCDYSNASKWQNLTTNQNSKWDSGNDDESKEEQWLIKQKIAEMPWNHKTSMWINSLPEGNLYNRMGSNQSVGLLQKSQSSIFQQPNNNIEQQQRRNSQRENEDVRIGSQLRRESSLRYVASPSPASNGQHTTGSQVKYKQQGHYDHQNDSVRQMSSEKVPSHLSEWRSHEENFSLSRSSKSFNSSSNNPDSDLLSPRGQTCDAFDTALAEYNVGSQSELVQNQEYAENSANSCRQHRNHGLNKVCYNGEQRVDVASLRRFSNHSDHSYQPNYSGRQNDQELHEDSRFQVSSGIVRGSPSLKTDGSLEEIDDCDEFWVCPTFQKPFLATSLRLDMSPAEYLRWYPPSYNHEDFEDAD